MELFAFALKFLALFNPKLKLFVHGRRGLFRYLENEIEKGDKVIWLHAASLGEYEQGLPILEGLKLNYPNHKLVLTFFSPSGYEVKKDTSMADITAYLPLDTKRNVQKFVDIVTPELAIFVKYEVWPNFMHVLDERQIPTLLVSAIFKKQQIYFKPFGGFMRKSLQRFSKIFVQNKDSRALLNSIGLNKVEISGDTRFDRVFKILQSDNRLEKIEKFKGDKLCFVAGSTWPEDEEVLIDFINSSKDIKIIIAPHKIDPEHLIKLETLIHKKTIRYSAFENSVTVDFDVLLVNNIGNLTKIYSYADIAYVGGGFKTGLHNTLEPGVFGIPVLIGPQYSGFAEAEALVLKGGITPIKNHMQFIGIMQKLLASKNERSKQGEINANFIRNNLGATAKILNHIQQILYFP